MNKLFPLLLLLSVSLPCSADSTYVGVDYVLTDIGLAGESAKPKAAALRIGVSNNNMAFEAQYLTTNDTKNIYRIEFDLEQSVGLYFVMQSDIHNGFGLDVSVGYAMTDLTVSGPDGTYSGEDHYNDFSWGVAIHQQIPYLEKAQIKLGYQSLYKDSDIDISGISLGFTYQF
ncbi:outer membrane beta-barrel protein [Thalassotalea piscium]